MLLSWPIFFFFYEVFVNISFPLSGARKHSCEKILLNVTCYFAKTHQVMIFLFISCSQRVISESEQKNWVLVKIGWLLRISSYLFKNLHRYQLLVCWCIVGGGGLLLFGNKSQRIGTRARNKLWMEEDKGVVYSYGLWDILPYPNKTQPKRWHCDKCSQRLPCDYWSWILVLTTWK